MTDGAEVKGLVLAEIVDGGIGEGFAGAEVAVAAEIVGGIVELEAELGGSGVENLDGLASDFGAGPVSGNQTDGIGLFHKGGH